MPARLPERCEPGATSRLFDTGLELGESLERLLFSCGGVTGDGGLANSFDLGLALVECHDQLTRVTDLLFPLVVR